MFDAGWRERIGPVGSDLEYGGPVLVREATGAPSSALRMAAASASSCARAPETFRAFFS